MITLNQAKIDIRAKTESETTVTIITLIRFCTASSKNEYQYHTQHSIAQNVQ